MEVRFLSTIIILVVITIAFSGCISNDHKDKKTMYSSSEAIDFIREYLIFNYDLLEIKTIQLHAVNTTDGYSNYWVCSFYIIIMENSTEATYLFRFPFIYSMMNYSFNDETMWTFFEHYIEMEISDIENLNSTTYIDSNIAIPKIMEYYLSNIEIEKQNSIYWKGVYFSDNFWKIVFRGETNNDSINIQISYNIIEDEFTIDEEINQKE